MTATDTVYVVDDDAAIRDALANLLAAEGLGVEAFADPDAFLAALPPRGACCVLLDMHLAQRSGLEVQRALAAGGIDLPVIFLTGFGTIPMTVQAMRAGAMEFLSKPVEDEVLLQAVRAALARDQPMAGLRARLASLTPREREVLGLTIGGLMNKQIAAAIGVSEVTAKVHKGRAIEKMGARSVAELVGMAQKLGIAPARMR